MNRSIAVFMIAMTALGQSAVAESSEQSCDVSKSWKAFQSWRDSIYHGADKSWHKDYRYFSTEDNGMATLAESFCTVLTGNTDRRTLMENNGARYTETADFLATYGDRDLHPALALLKPFLHKKMLTANDVRSIIRRLQFGDDDNLLIYFKVLLSQVLVHEQIVAEAGPYYSWLPDYLAHLLLLTKSDDFRVKSQLNDIPSGFIARAQRRIGLLAMQTYSFSHIGWHSTQPDRLPPAMAYVSYQPGMLVDHQDIASLAEHSESAAALFDGLAELVYEIDRTSDKTIELPPIYVDTMQNLRQTHERIDAARSIMGENPDSHQCPLWGVLNALNHTIPFSIHTERKLKKSYVIIKPLKARLTGVISNALKPAGEWTVSLKSTPPNSIQAFQVIGQDLLETPKTIDEWITTISSRDVVVHGSVLPLRDNLLSLLNATKSISAVLGEPMARSLRVQLSALLNALITGRTESFADRVLGIEIELRELLAQAEFELARFERAEASFVENTPYLSELNRRVTLANDLLVKAQNWQENCQYKSETTALEGY